jgi:trimeric autotransporter adhesin
MNPERLERGKVVGRKIRGHIRTNVVVGATLVFTLTGGTAYALNGSNTVFSDDIANGQVKNADLAISAVNSAKIRDGGVTGADVADNSLKGADVREPTLDFTVLQRRIATACPPGKAIRAVTAAGDVTCQNSSGSVTSVDSGTGLTGGPITTSGALSIASAFRLPQDCANGEIPKSDGSGSWQCGTDQDSPGTDWHVGGNAGTTGTDFLGTTDAQPLALDVNGARALRLEPASDGTNESPNVIGGIADNSVTSGAFAATIGGGGRSDPADPATANTVTDSYGTIGGGAKNRAGDAAGTTDDMRYATVAGGVSNTAGAVRATVGGGFNNTASGATATIPGGFGNTASSNASTIGGGDGNAGSAAYTTIAGGRFNTASGDASTVGGGLQNTASGAATAVGSPAATVAGGFGNSATGVRSTVPGGSGNAAQGDFSIAGGRRAKAIHNGADVWADSSPFDFSSTAADQLSLRFTGGTRLVSSIDGSGNPASGVELPAGGTGWSTLVSGQPFDINVNGSRGLRIQPASDGTNQSPNVIGGIADNSVTSGAYGATIAGGGRQFAGSPASANRVTDALGTVGGGANNQAGDNAGGTSGVADALYPTVAGGVENRASARGGAVAGGCCNQASGQYSAVAGGESNQASGTDSAVGGGASNTASGPRATVPGGFGNTASGSFSFASGESAHATHDGSFVWGDGSNTTSSTATNSFVARASGGFTFYTGSSNATPVGATLPAASGSWTSLSDRSSKAAIRPVSGRAVLRKLQSLRIDSWRYAGERQGIRHMGPMAQGFYRAFGLGADNKHIASVDADGVSLAATKGLAQAVERQRSRLRSQGRQIESLKRAVRRLSRER